ncbi:MAG: hypothetical protein OXB86_02070 [Bdellovibrionales bacterium]|nr:hypothetical protein [Bdellovibrionales bacterium]
MNLLLALFLIFFALAIRSFGSAVLTPIFRFFSVCLCSMWPVMRGGLFGLLFLFSYGSHSGVCKSLFYTTDKIERKERLLFLIANEGIMTNHEIRALRRVVKRQAGKLIGDTPEQKIADKLLAENLKYKVPLSPQMKAYLRKLLRD